MSSIYVESHLNNLSPKFYEEVTQQMFKHADYPGSNNGTGLFQTIIGVKKRDLHKQIISEKAAPPVKAAEALALRVQIYRGLHIFFSHNHSVVMTEYCMSHVIYN